MTTEAAAKGGKKEEKKVDTVVVEKKEKPTKPDEEAFKKSRDQAEKEWKDAQEKLVCRTLTPPYTPRTPD